MSTAIIVGAGFGGLASALRLKRKGYKVLVLDRQDQLGGRATVYRRTGFTYDAGPTVITAPFLIEELFDLFGRNWKDYLTLVPVAPWYLIRFDDGSTFRYGGSLEETLEEIRRFSPGDVAGYQKFLKQCQKIFDVGFVQLGDRPFLSPQSMLSVAPDMVALKSFMTVYQLISRYIKNEKLRQVFSFHPLLVGGNPFNTTSIYSLIHHLEREYGVWYAMGGTGAIVSALAKLMAEVGIEVRLGSQVKRILTEQATAVGVEMSDGKFIMADLVVCNADPPFVYKNMIAEGAQSKWNNRRIEKLKYSMGLFVLYFGTSKQYPDLAHHTILLGKRYKELLEDIFERKVLAEDFSLYLHAPSRTDPSMAPPGHECFYVLAPVPNLQGAVDWAEEGDKFAAKILRYLEATVLPGLNSHIVDQFYVTPEHFRDNLLSHHGTGFSIQPTLLQSAYFRFHNKSEEIENLYFVGAGTHPGAGLPGVLTSAKVLDRIIPSLENKASELSSVSLKPAFKNESKAFSESPQKSNISAGALKLSIDNESLEMERRARTFSWASLFLPRAIKDDLKKLYSFCRYVDDCADQWNNKANALKSLEQISTDLVQKSSRIEVVQSFIELSQRKSIPTSFALELVRGVKADLGLVRVSSEEELLRYSYQVAGTVGVMICHLLGVTDRNAVAAGIDLAIGMQLTNIARDVQEDFHQDRIYIPASLISPERLVAALANEEGAQKDLLKAVTRITDLSENYYRSADNGICYLPPRVRLGILLASRAYEKIGQVIVGNPAKYLSKARINTSHLEKFHCLVDTLWSLTDPRYHRTIKAPAHKTELHRALQGFASVDVD